MILSKMGYRKLLSAHISRFGARLFSSCDTARHKNNIILLLNRASNVLSWTSSQRFSIDCLHGFNIQDNAKILYGQSQRWIGTGVKLQDGSQISGRPFLSTVSKKRRKRRVIETQKENCEGEVVAYAISDEIDVDEMERCLKENGLYHVSERPDDMDEALHLSRTITTDEYYGESSYYKEFFVFREGALVCWNIPEFERHDMVKFLTRNIENHYKVSDIIDDDTCYNDTMDFSIVQTESNIVGKKFLVRDSNDVINEDKYAFSNALAQSVKLSVLEETMDTFKEDLDSGLTISKREVVRKLGEILTLRYEVNLRSNLFDESDFYWDRENAEQNYRKASHYLSIDKRANRINQQLDYCKELLYHLDSKFNDEKHTRLEWIIIILIAIEVIFALPVCVRDWGDFLNQYYEVDQQINNGES